MSENRQTDHPTSTVSEPTGPQASGPQASGSERPDPQRGGDRLRTVVLGAGCFWCLDSLARRLQGVHQVRSVYTGGTAQTANYQAVASSTTDHAEAVEITFDPDELPATVVFDVFFSSHDPTSLNRQGHDVGPQYRSAMFYRDEAEQREFTAAVERAQQSYDRPIVTSLESLGPVYEAEPEHQDFYARRPEVGYCQFIIDPKVTQLRRGYAPWLRAGAPL